MQGGGAGDLAVEGGVAEFAGVGGGLPVAGGEVVAGELADEGVGGGIVGAPAAVDDLSVVAGVVGVAVVGAGGEQPQRGAVAELAKRRDGGSGFGDRGLGWRRGVPHGDVHPGGAGSGDKLPGARQVGPVPAAVGGWAIGIGAVAAVAGQVGRQDLAGRLGGARAAIAGDDLAAVQGEIDGLADAELVERRGVDVEEHEGGDHLRVDAQLAAVVGEVRGVTGGLAEVRHEVARTIGDGGGALGCGEAEADHDPVRVTRGLGGG